MAKANMNSGTLFSLALKESEIEWILWQLDAPTERLYHSSFRDRSPKGVEKAFEEAEASLLDRGLIVKEPDGAPALDATCAGMVGVLGFSSVVLQADLFRERSPVPTTYRYYVAEELIVEEYAEEGGQTRLTALRDPDVLRNRLHRQLNLQGQQQPDRSAAFQCREETFAAIPYTLAGDGEAAAIRLLTDGGVDEQLATELISAMNSPIQQSALHVVKVDGDHPQGRCLVRQMAIFEGVYGLWISSLQVEDDASAIDIVPCNAEQAKRAVDNVLAAFLS